MRRAAIVLAGTVILSACISEPVETEVSIVGPGATEADFLNSLSNEELFPDLSPEGAEVMRAFIDTPASAFGGMLSFVMLGFDCARFPVTDETLPQFDRYVGETLLRANGMPEEEIPLVADEVGKAVVTQGMARLPDDDFVYSAEGDLLGIARCA